MSKRSLRILAYSDSRQSFGAEAVFCDVVRALSSVPGFDVTVAASSENQILWTATQGMGVDSIDVPPHPARLVPIGVWNPRRGLTIRERLNGRPWDAMFVNLPGVEYGSGPLLWAQKCGASKIGILHLHQSIRATSAERPLGGARDRLARTLLHRLDHALVISPFGRESVAHTWGLPIESCSVLPLLARKAERVTRPEARHRLGLPAEPTIVGMVGRIELGQKGHDVFVAAAERLARADPNIRFAVVGEGPDEASVREMVATARLTGRFHFLGTIRPADLAFGALDAIAFPSRFEGLPLTAIEAMSVGLPGVASRVDGLAALWPPEWTTDPGDPAALAERLAQVLACAPGLRTNVLAEAERRTTQFLTADLAPLLEALLYAVNDRKTRT